MLFARPIFIFLSARYIQQEYRIQIMTNKITPADIKSRKLYEEYRKNNFQRILNEFRLRRIRLGTNLLLQFQNFELILFQLQELLRAERIYDDQGISKYIRIYNQLIPDQNQLSGLLITEFQSKEEIQTILNTFRSMPKNGAVRLETDDIVVYGNVNNNSVNSPQNAYRVIFEFSVNQLNHLVSNNNSVLISFQLSNYEEKVALPTQTARALCDDLGMK
jgi:hypothetical protein